MVQVPVEDSPVREDLADCALWAGSAANPAERIACYSFWMRIEMETARGQPLSRDLRIATASSCFSGFEIHPSVIAKIDRHKAALRENRVRYSILSWLSVMAEPSYRSWPK